MRKGEILNLQWSNIDFDYGFIELLETKSGKARKIPISKTMLELLNNTPRISEFVFFNSTVTKGNTNRNNIQDLEKILVNEGYEPFLNKIDDVNAAMDLLNVRGTGDSWLANLTTQMTRPALKTQRWLNQRNLNLDGLRNFKQVGRQTITPMAVQMLPLQGSVTKYADDIE